MLQGKSVMEMIREPVQTDKRIPLSNEPVVSFHAKMVEPARMEFATEYRLGFDVQTRIIVPEERDDRYRESVLNNMQHEMAHAVYGDVIRGLRNLYPEIATLYADVGWEGRKAVCRLDTKIGELLAELRP